MQRMNYYLILALLMSLLWGIFVLMVGLVLHYGMGQLIQSYLEGVVFTVDLKGTVNTEGDNICPIETNPGNHIYLGEWSTVIGSLMMSTGFVIIIYSLTGVMAGILHNDIMILLLLLVIAVVFCLEYYIFQLTSSINNPFHEDAQAELVKILQSEYNLKPKVNIFTATMNAIMLKTECCGIQGPNDFTNLTFQENGQIVYFVVSPACCEKSIFNSNPEDKFSLLKNCAKTGHSDLINSLGCYPELYNYVADNYGILVILGIIVLCVWQIVQVVFMLMLLFKEPIVAKAAAVKDAHKTMTDEVIKKTPTKFIPYWKTSSFVSEDVQRIRSTEIW